MKARYLTLLTVVLCCSACSAPSLRHKKEVNKLLSAGEFTAAAAKIEAGKNKEYSRRDRALFYLDSAAVLHDAAQYAESDRRLSFAQDRIEELFTQSISAHTAQYLVNDLTVPYTPAAYEQALTYYYRAMNFLSKNNIADAAVEANRAVHFLDQLRGSTGQDNPFVQYFMSLIFESAGRRDDARIARTRAVQAYGAAPVFPEPVEGFGEVVLVHSNGVIPLKKSATFQVGWGRVLVYTQSHQESARGMSPQIHNAINAGLLGGAVTVAYPVLEEQPYTITASEVVTQQGQVYATQLLGDVAGAARAELKDKETGTLVRAALRAAAKRVAAVQARHVTNQNTDAKAWGDVAEMFVSFLGALTEKADTRQWFTLPAQLRMTRFYVPPGTQDITLRFKNRFGKIVGTYTFENVPVTAGGRVYLHYRTAK